MSDVSCPDSADRTATVDLLGMLALGELTAFSRLAADADMAPAVAGREAFARLALVEFGHYELLLARLLDLTGAPEAAMAPYAPVFAAYHERTRPGTWLEAVVKAYVGDGIAADFSREIARFVDAESRAAIEAAMDDRERSAVLVRLAAEGMQSDPHVRGRLALWARRLHGEAVSQAQTVAAQRESLTTLLTGSGPQLDLVALGELFARLARRHTERMAALGLEA